MAMSRKHYREAAEVIARALPSERDMQSLSDGAGERHNACLEIAVGLANMFKADNSAFRRDQFMEACGL